MKGYKIEEMFDVKAKKDAITLFFGRHKTLVEKAADKQ